MKANAAQIIKALIGRVSPMEGLLCRLAARIYAGSAKRQAENLLQCDAIVKNPTSVSVHGFDFKRQSGFPHS